MRSPPHTRFTYSQLNEMAAIAAEATGAAQAGVAVTLVNQSDRQAFAIWTIGRD